jgi:hypothetical protein
LVTCLRRCHSATSQHPGAATLAWRRRRFAAVLAWAGRPCTRARFAGHAVGDLCTQPGRIVSVSCVHARATRVASAGRLYPAPAKRCSCRASLCRLTTPGGYSAAGKIRAPACLFLSASKLTILYCFRAQHLGFTITPQRNKTQDFSTCPHLASAQPLRPPMDPCTPPRSPMSPGCVVSESRPPSTQGSSQ